VYLKVLPMRRLRHFKVRGKLTPRFIGPFEIMKREKKNSRQSFRISFPIRPHLEDEIHFKEGRFVRPQNSKFWNVTKIH
jgi:hypothetical protein